MSTATQYITDLITNQIREHHLVVWFDPGKQYETIVENLDVPGVAIHKYTESFIQLRHEIADLMQGEKPSDLLLYIPKDEKETDNALIAFTRAGITLQPGQHPWQRNTRLSVIARQVLKSNLTDQELNEIENKIEDGHLTLADIDKITEEIRPDVSEALTLVYDTRSGPEILLLFITNPTHDAELIAKDLLSNIKALITEVTDFSPRDESIEKQRADFIKYLLLSAFICEIGETPSKFNKVPHAKELQYQESCKNLVYTWQNRREYVNQYEQYSKNIETTLQISKLEIPANLLVKSRVFPGSEQALILVAEEACVPGSETGIDVGELAGQRLTMYWAMQDPAISFRWKILQEISQFFSLTSYLEHRIPSKVWSVNDLISEYTIPEKGWYLFDTLHRTVLKHQYDETLDSGWQDEFLDKIIGKVQNQYSKTAELMTNALTQAMAREGTSNVKIPIQTRIFKQFVNPDEISGKTAYILVDAFRYEMGVALHAVLNNGGEIFAALAMLPSYTPVGMAALLPGAEKGFSLVLTENKEISPVIEKKPLLSRDDRIAYLRENVRGEVLVLKLSDFLPRPKKKIEGQITKSSFILITSQEIDASGELMESHIARSYMDDIIRSLKRVIMHLSRLGVTRIVITADHGYLYGEELIEARKIDSPGGQTISLHRRFWAGNGGEARESYVRIKPETVGIKSDIEFAYPSGIGAFKVQGGGTEYYHGGISLQELVIPVITIEKSTNQPSTDTSIVWTLSISGPKISSRMVSVRIIGTISSITYDQIPKVRVEVRSGNIVISTPLTAHYGYIDATGEIQMKICPDPEKDRSLEEDTAIMQVHTIPESGQATIHLLDSETDVELYKIGPFPVDISF